MKHPQIIQSFETIETGNLQRYDKLSIKTYQKSGQKIHFRRNQYASLKFTGNIDST